MSYAQYLRQLLAPLGVYNFGAPFQSGELEALGAAFDQVEEALEETRRETCLATAEEWGLEKTAALFRRRPPAPDVEAMREALAALLRISGDSFTLEAVNDAITGCGINAKVEETDQAGTVEVSFPQTPGIPPNFSEIRAIIEDIIPAHLRIQYRYWYLLWEELEEKFACWQDIEDLDLTWSELEAYVAESGT